MCSRTATTAWPPVQKAWSRGRPAQEPRPAPHRSGYMEYPLRRACRRTMSHKAAIQSTLQFSLGCGCGSAVGPAPYIGSNTPPVPDVWRLLADGGAWPNEQALSRRRGRSKGGRGFPGTVRARLSRDRIQRAGPQTRLGPQLHSRISCLPATTGIISGGQGSIESECLTKRQSSTPGLYAMSQRTSAYMSEGGRLL